MKLRTTKKEIRNNARDILSASYCSMQYLLNYNQPFSYCTDTNGWACDNYEVDNVIISTGYRPIGNKGVFEHNEDHHYQHIIEAEKEARVIVQDSTLSWSEKETLIADLLSELIKTLKG